MRTNHAPGADRSSTGRSHGRRNIAADARPRTVALVALLTAEPARGGGPGRTARSGGYFGPLFLPHRVVGAVVFSVPAGFDRGLPELDRVEVRARRIGVVLRARARLQL